VLLLNRRRSAADTDPTLLNTTTEQDTVLRYWVFSHNPARLALLGACPGPSFVRCFLAFGLLLRPFIRLFLVKLDTHCAFFTPAALRLRLLPSRTSSCTDLPWPGTLHLAASGVSIGLTQPETRTPSVARLRFLRQSVSMVSFSDSRVHVGSRNVI
jgi:hypothetical protein